MAARPTEEISARRGKSPGTWTVGATRWLQAHAAAKPADGAESVTAVTALDAERTCAAHTTSPLPCEPCQICRESCFPRWTIETNIPKTVFEYLNALDHLCRLILKGAGRRLARARRTVRLDRRKVEGRRINGKSGLSVNMSNAIESGADTGVIA